MKNFLVSATAVLVYLFSFGQAPFAVKDIYPGSNDGSPTLLTAVNGKLFFRASDGVNGFELWVSNGTTGGTVMVKDLNPGSLSTTMSNLINWKGVLYFAAKNSANGYELWKSDGTTPGTLLVKDINPGAGDANPSNFLIVKDTLFFTADDGVKGTELWKSDGTTGGTVLVKDINSSDGSFPAYLTNVNDTLFFTADDGTNGLELWKSDGSDVGTGMVKDINAGSLSSSLNNLTNVNGTLFFAADNGINDVELWKSDGTNAGTVLVKDINASGSSSPAELINMNGTLFFVADDGINGVELWKSNGTGAGTTLVKDIRAGSGYSSPQYLTVMNGNLYFKANDGTVNGTELWKSDGSGSGTVLVKDINPGLTSSNPSEIRNVNGILYFSATDATHGNEIWRSDGTTVGTINISDIYLGVSGSNPTLLTDVNGTLYFRAIDTVAGSGNGFELWALQSITKPIASYSLNDTLFCVGDTVKFINTSTNFLLCKWFVNGILKDSTTNFSILMDTAGVYSILFVVYNVNLVDSLKKNITIGTSFPSNVTIKSSPSDTLCSGETITFNATTSNGGSAPIFQWRLNGTTVGSNSSTYSNSSLVTGDNIKCTMISSSNCVSGSPAVTSNQLTMFVKPAMSITITASDTDICSTDSIKFIATVSNGGLTKSYQWILNNLAVGGDTNVVTLKSLNDQDTIKCVVTSTSTCPGDTIALSNPIGIKVNPMVNPSLSISPNSNPVCLGSTITFTAIPINGGTAPFYQWKVNGVNVGINSSSFVTSTLVDKDTVSCWMISNTSCRNFDSAFSNIVVITITPTTTSVTITTPDTITCSGQTVTFTAVPYNGGSSPFYQWKKNGFSVGANSTTYSLNILANNDKISCSITSNSNCASPKTGSSNVITMTVNPYKTPAVNVVVADNPACPNSNVIFTATPLNGGISPQYQWKKNRVNVGIDNFEFSTTTLINNDTVYCVMTSNNVCISTNPVNSNFIVMTVGTVTPSITISAASATTICSGTNVKFTSVVVNGGTAPAYQWRINGLDVAGEISDIFNTSSLADNDIVTCSLTSTALCPNPVTATSNSITMTVTLAPTGPDNVTYCNAETKKVKLSSLVSPQGGIWAAPGEVVIIAPDTLDVTNTPLTTITGTPYQLVYTLNGCSKNIELYINGSDAGVDFTYCPKNAGPFTLPSGQPAGGTWSSIGSGGITNNSTGAVNPAGLSGKIKYIYNYSGCSDTLVVNYIQLNLSLTKSDVTCNGGNDGKIDLSVVGGNTPYSYFWSNSLTTKNINNLAAGTYFVTVTDINSCYDVTSETVDQPTSLSLTIFTTDDNGTQNGTANVSVTGGSPGYTFEWGTIPVQTAAKATKLAAGTYKVIITDSHGCKDSAYATVNPSTGLSLLNSDNHIAIHPNPVADKIFIDLNFSSNEHVSLEVQDVAGRIIYSEKALSIRKDEISVDMSNEQAGIYFFKILTKKDVWIRKIVLVK